MHINTNQSRRSFLRRIAQLGALGAAAPLASSLGLIGEAAAATAEDYKALVCVFLNGGNDYANTLPPFDQQSYDLYSAARPSLAIPRDDLASFVLSSGEAGGGRQYALNPSLGSLMPIAENGNLAAVLNVGALIQPTTKMEYLNKSVPLPPKLFSHNDQASFIQSFQAEGSTSGWAGRMGDLLEAGNGNAGLTCITANGNAVYLWGKHALPFAIGEDGPVPLVNGATALYGSPGAYSALRQVMTSARTSMFGSEHARISKRALDTFEYVSAGLAYAPEGNFGLFPRGNPLAAQLKIIARMIASSAEMGMKRQVFFASMGGWDMHDGLATRHPAALLQLAGALKAFYETTEQLGVAGKVTTFTASEFGRSLAVNVDGSDHGWGGVQFVMGGAVRGNRLYGTPPAIGFETDDDVGAGRLLPTTSIDQMAATLAMWFGISPGDLTAVIPNLCNYNPSAWNLDFL